jgi:predicted ATPase
VVAVVEGPAGIGKTALLDSLRHHAQDLSDQVLFARGGELERTDAYGIVQQLFGPPLASSKLAELSLPARGVLDASEGPLAPPGEDAARAIHHELFGLCVRLADTKQLLIVVDDAHWADERSLRWLLFIARRIDRLPMAVVIARRAREPGVDMELLDRMSALDRTEVLTVSPLSGSASASLVRSVLGESADEAFCDACHDATGGNPFLLRALLAELEATGVTPTREAAALALSIGPRAVQRVTLLRLARVSPAAIALARAIALLDEADVVTAARLAELDERSATQAASALGDAGLLAPGPGLRFAHPLVRSAIYAEIDEHERGRLHRDAAWALSAGDAPAERVAAHLLAAHPAGDSRAVDSLRAAVGSSGAAATDASR